MLYTVNNNINFNDLEALIFTVLLYYIVVFKNQINIIVIIIP